MTAEPATVRWGVLGWASIARRAIVPAIGASSGGRLVAVASESGDAATIGGELPSVHVHSGPGAYAALLEREDVDAVYVAVPNHLHLPLVEAAAAHGKHVLCEKPLSVSAEGARRAAECSAAAGTLLMEAMMAAFNPQHDRVRDLVAAGAIGRPRVFRASFTVRLQDPERDIRFRCSPGAGALFDLGVYCVSAARWIFEAEPTAVRSVSLDLPGSDGDELSAVLLRFPAGRLAVIDCGLTLEPRNVYEVIGAEGAITVSRPFASPPFVAAERALELTVTRQGRAQVERSPDRDQYALQIEAFQSALKGEGGSLYPLQESIGTAQVLDACLAMKDRDPDARPWLDFS